MVLDTRRRARPLMVVGRRVGVGAMAWARPGSRLAAAVAVGIVMVASGCEESPAGGQDPTAASSSTTAASSTSQLPPCTWAPVIRVVDGDTIHVRLGGREETLRYIGVDAPETVKPDTPVQPFGPEASAFNKSLVSGKTVCLEKDVSERDQYGRLLRYVWLADGRMVNEELLRAGMARVVTFPPDVKYHQTRLLPAERAARGAGTGLWGK